MRTRPAIRAAGAVLDYLQETQRTSLDHFDRLIPYRVGTYLEVDEATRRSLEISRTIREGRRDGSLLAVIDRTLTAMGSRLLGERIAAPLTDGKAINTRLDAVQELVDSGDSRNAIREDLRGIYDVERLLARVATGRASPRDLSFIGRTLTELPPLKEQLATLKCPLLCQLHNQLDLCADIREQLQEALADECPLTLKDGGIIRRGYRDELDTLRDLATGGKRWIAEYQAQETERLGIPI